MLLLGCVLVATCGFVLAWVIGIRLVSGYCVVRELLQLCGDLFGCGCGLVLLIVLYWWFFTCAISDLRYVGCGLGGFLRCV